MQKGLFIINSLIAFILRHMHFTLIDLIHAYMINICIVYKAYNCFIMLYETFCFYWNLLFDIKAKCV